MQTQTAKNIKLAVLFGLIFTILCSIAQFDAACEELRDNVLRIHILANSDSEADQSLKLKVRDALLEAGNDVFTSDMSLEDAITATEQKLPEFTALANRVVRENGFDYDVRLSLGKAQFNTREYDDFALPAGEYDALRVEIGAAEGKNWWCVMFPAICVGAASDGELSDTVEEEGVYVAEHEPEFQVRFKIVEIYESIRAFFTGEKEYRR